MPETVSLKEALRAALEAEDAREAAAKTEAAGGTAQDVVEEAQRVEMTFIEDAGELVPLEGAA